MLASHVSASVQAYTVSENQISLDQRAYILRGFVAELFMAPPTYSMAFRFYSENHGLIAGCH